jgi:hypothetical protein
LSQEREVMAVRKWMVFLSAVIVAIVPTAAIASDEGAETQESCVVFLEPASGPEGTEFAKPVDLGCYDTLAEAIGATTGIVLPEDVTGAELTQEILDEAAAQADAPEAAVVIGIDWVNQSYSGEHLITETAYGCAGGVTWGTSYVTDYWNDRFESGKAYASCDRGRKFENSNYGGA